MFSLGATAVALAATLGSALKHPSVVNRAAALGNATAAHLTQRSSAGVAETHLVNTESASGLRMMSQPCQCKASDPTWVPATRTIPKCIFVDLGAANGNTVSHFLANGYGPISNCPNGGDWEAFLVEANPRFDQDLQGYAAKYPGKIHSLSSTAAYMCEATTSFNLDTQNAAQNYWGSSMSDTHPDAQKSGLVKVTVPTMNLMRLLKEHTIPGDWVMVKMDIEGAEWDLVPCLSQSPEASLIDRLYLEQHPAQWQLGHTTEQQMQDAKTKLKQMKVDIPDYFSWTL